MSTQEKTTDLLNPVHGDSSTLMCCIDETPEKYTRLLEGYNELLKTLEFNPYMSLAHVFLLSLNPRFQYRFWRSGNIRDFVRVPDAVRQDLPFVAQILKSIETLNDVQLRALARCSGLNVRKLTNRFVFGGPNKVFVTLTALLAVAKGLKEIFGIDLAGYAPSLVRLVAPLLIGLAVGVVFNLLVWYQRLRLVRALDDIISIVMAARNLK
jgi:hypothetical protein